MILKKRNLFVSIVAISLTFCFSFLCSAAQIYVSFPGSGIWVNNSWDYSGDWQGEWEDYTNQSYQFAGHFTQADSYISGKISFNYAECGTFSEVPISGLRDMNNGTASLNAHVSCLGTRLDLKFSGEIRNLKEFRGTYESWSGDQLWDHGFIDLQKTGPLLSQITPSTPENIIYSGSTLYADFGKGGIWLWNGSSWTMLTPSNPENMVAGSGTLYADFGAGGIWQFIWTKGWTMLTPSNPENMVVAGTNLYAEFGAGGIWMWNGSSWSMLTPSNPENMVAGSGSNIYAEFGAGGIWKWNGSTWSMLTPSNPENMVVCNNLLYADFGAGGIYDWSQWGWRMIANANPENMVAYDSCYTLFADFGAGGLYMWDGTAWTMLTASNPIGIAVSN